MDPAPAKGMKNKLSSSGTFFHKRVFPVIWFGGLAILLVTGLSAASETNGPGLAFAIVAIVMGLFGYVLLKNLVSDLADEVYDEGDSLVCRKSGKQVRIYLKDIKNLNYQNLVSPPRVTLPLRRETDLGDEISFSPPPPTSSCSGRTGAYRS